MQSRLHGGHAIMIRQCRGCSRTAVTFLRAVMCSRAPLVVASHSFLYFLRGRKPVRHAGMPIVGPQRMRNLAVASRGASERPKYPGKTERQVGERIGSAGLPDAAERISRCLAIVLWPNEYKMLVFDVR